MVTNRNLARKIGQGMSEYLIIVVLVAMAVLAAVKTLGGKVKTTFNDTTTHGIERELNVQNVMSGDDNGGDQPLG